MSLWGQSINPQAVAPVAFLRGPLAGCAAPLAAAGLGVSGDAWAPRSWVATRAAILWLEDVALDAARRVTRAQSFWPRSASEQNAKSASGLLRMLPLQPHVSLFWQMTRARRCHLKIAVPGAQQWA